MTPTFRYHPAMGGPILAVDPGSVRIGLALSDEGRSFAFPAGVIHRKEGDPIALLVQKVVQERVTCLVVGLPLSLDGTEGPGARRARKLAEAVAEACAKEGVTLSLFFVDERFTSQTAHRVFDEAGVSQKKRRGKVDAAAATMILERFLEAENRNSAEESW